MIKYKLDQVIEIFKNNNCELLSKTYKNNTTELDFKCKCNNNVKMSFKKYLVQLCCNECHKKTLTRIFKYDFDYVKKYFQDNNCELLSKEYKDNKSDLDYICKCKNKAKICFKAFLNGQRCSKCAMEKRKNTNLELYGNECSMNSKERIQQRKENQSDLTKKRKETNLKKYGVKIATQNHLVSKKREDTNVERYGFEYACQNVEVKEKIKATNLERYGFEYACQNPKIHEKIFKQRTKKYTLPSGKEINIQGYENYALDILLHQYTEDELLNSKSDMPTIRYKYKKINRRYFPDIYIPKDNKIIEVKSIWTYKRELIKNIFKALNTRKMGYDYELWIFDKKEIIYNI
jgi:hypothetical protein